MTNDLLNVIKNGNNKKEILIFNKFVIIVEKKDGQLWKYKSDAE